MGNTEEGANQSGCLAVAPIEPRSNFRSKYRLRACTSVTSYRAFVHLRVREREFNWQVSTRFIIMAAVFDRFVIPSSHARLVSRTRVSIPMYYCDSLSVGYFGSPGLEFIPGREKISGIRGTNDSVGWLRNWTRSTNGKHSVPISNALFFTFILNRFFKLYVKLRSFHRTDN